MGDPISTLRQIAYRLEAEGAPTYKVRAFRTAASVAEDAGSEVIERLARAGRLTSLTGIGTTTAEVITEVLAHGRASYLDALEERAPAAPSGPAGALRAALRGDCHSHSDWSDGGSPIRDMALAAKALGHEYLVLTDHSPRLTVAHGLSRERLLEQRDVVIELNSELAPFRLLRGIEVDIFDDGSLDQDDDLLDQLDIVVASAHSKLRMEAPAMTRRLVAAVENPRVDILGHATGRIITGKGRPESAFDHAAVFRACAAAGTAVEVNSRPDRQDPRQELLEVALKEGCLLSIDSDAHAPGQLEWLRLGCAQAVAAGAGPNEVVNTRTAEDLLSWASEHGS